MGYGQLSAGPEGAEEAVRVASEAESLEVSGKHGCVLSL